MAPDKLFGLIDLNWRYDLTQHRPVRALLRSRWFPILPILFNMFLFVVILIAAFMGGFSSPGNFNFAVMMVWIVWWVALMFMLVPLFGRSWCMMCPFPVVGDFIQRGRLIDPTDDKTDMDRVKKGKIRGLGKKWPQKLRNMWMLNFIFLITTFFSPFMTVRPMATFILLAIIIVVAIITAWIYEKRTFCRYLCPVSGFIGLYSQFAPVEVRRNHKPTCDKHFPKTCWTGNEKGWGCSWMQLPFMQKKNTYCGFCFECFKTCPYDNMSFYVRPPGTDLLVKERGLDESWKAFLMIGIAIVFSVSYQGPWEFIKEIAHMTSISNFLVFITAHATLSMVLIPLIFFIFCWFSKLFSGSKETPLKQIFLNFSYALIPLGLGVWVAFSFGILFPNGSYILHVISDPFAWGWNLFGTAGIPWTPVLTYWTGIFQGIALLIFYTFAVAYGFRLSKQTYPTLKHAKRGWYPILTVLTLSTVGFLGLFIGG